MKKASNKSLSSADFYDDVSEFYEKMIDFEKNLQLRVNAYKNIFERIGSVADLGCGIGLDSIALAMNGHDVTAFDISPKMIGETNKNAIKFNVEIKTQISSLESIPKVYMGHFQNVVCVGNTIAHLNASQLKKAFSKIHGLLKPNGRIFLHILNYEKIVKQNKRVNNIAVRNGMAIIRFYDFFREHINFNIMSFKLDNPKDFKLVTTKHFLHTKAFINRELKSAGFRSTAFFENFERKPFVRLDSKDMFITATK
ncbi:MAG: class I SAM-dependent methyltransferase [Bacteroidetes bacterium]|nr:class I SAM-dependent methyltransferase [Bacteroidota bacterium]MCL5027441.1 class I SAM-dependent methyltransferase [Bacteroidota bacterium]